MAGTVLPSRLSISRQQRILGRYDAVRQSEIFLAAHGRRTTAEKLVLNHEGRRFVPPDIGRMLGRVDSAREAEARIGAKAKPVIASPPAPAPAAGKNGKAVAGGAASAPRYRISALRSLGGPLPKILTGDSDEVEGFDDPFAPFSPTVSYGGSGSLGGKKPEPS